MDSAPRRDLFDIFSKTLQEQFFYRLSASNEAQNWPKTAISFWHGPFTAKSPKVWPPLINQFTFMQTLTNQMSRKVSSWLLIGLNLHVRMRINQNRSHIGPPKGLAPCYFTAKSPKVWPPLINSHSFMQTLSNQTSRKFSAGFRLD